MNKEQIIEIIREKVIMANNPGCKIYEEALEKESKDVSCLYEIIRDDGRKEIGCGYWYSDYSFTTDKSKRVLGLPLTLERVLVCINNKVLKFDNGVEYKEHEDVMYKTGTIVCYDGRDICELCEWRPNKTLDEQPNETIKTICSILED